MVLGLEKLRELIRKKGLIENLPKEELERGEGVGFDLRIGELYEISGRGFLGITERCTPKVKLVAKYEEGKKNTFILKPSSYYLMKTIEKVNTPSNIAGLFLTRTSLFRSGIVLFTAIDDPGYKGELVFGITNLGPCDFELEMGARVVRMIFFEVAGETTLYKGQWQGGRVAAEKKEKQI